MSPQQFEGNLDGEEALKITTLYLPVEYFQRLDKLVAKGIYPSRSEAIRIAVRDLILEEENMKLHKEKFGVVDGRGAPVLVHDEVVTSSQAQDAKSGVKNSPPSTKEKELHAMISEPCEVCGYRIPDIENFPCDQKCPKCMKGWCRKSRGEVKG